MEKLKHIRILKMLIYYYNHGDIGYNLLEKYGYDDRFLFLVKNHHNNNIIEDIELDILKECDDRN